MHCRRSLALIAVFSLAACSIPNSVQQQISEQAVIEQVADGEHQLVS